MNTKSKQTELINKKVMPTFNLSTKPDRTINNVSTKPDKTINNLSTKPDKTINNVSTNRINNNSTFINVSTHRLNNNTTIFKNPSILNCKMNDVSQINSTDKTNKLLNSINKFNKTNSIKSNNKLNTTKLITKQLPTTSTKSIYDYPCQLCELNFDTIERLDFHLIKIHKIDKRINLVQCYVNDCEDKFNKRMQLVDHLINIHNLDIRVYQDTIKSLDEFFKWKDKLESDSGFKWLQNNTFYLNNRLRKTYICNRTATNGIKLYSLHGLTTINNHSALCLSSIKITENENGEFLIEFIETHNHDE